MSVAATLSIQFPLFSVCTVTNSRLEKWVISVRYYVYNEMIKLVPMKVPVRKYSDVDWRRQVKNTELTRSFIIPSRYFTHSPLIVLNSCCKRNTH